MGIIGGHSSDSMRDPLVSNVMYPWSKSWSICEARANPLYGSNRSSAVSQTRQGLIWLARKNAGLATLVIGQAPSSLITLLRNCNWPMR